MKRKGIIIVVSGFSGADCKQPVAAYAFRQDGELRMEAALWENGRRLSAEEIDSRREKRLQGE